MKVDDLLGTNNYKKYVSRNFSVDSMLPLIGIPAHNIGLGLLIIDETQNLSGVEQIMNFFVNLINSGVNLVLIGTLGSYRTFENELRIARRLTGNSEIKGLHTWIYVHDRDWYDKVTPRITKRRKKLKAPTGISGMMNV